MVEQEFKKNQALLTEKADKVIEMEGTVQKFEQEVERLRHEVRLARSSEASDEVVERLRKEKDELKKIATAMETRKNQYKQLVKI
jgi:methyl-accepting chemotaxis protein